MRSLAILVPCVLVVVAAGCGTGATTDCKVPPDRDLLLAIKAHAGKVQLPSESEEGNAARLTITACQTSDTKATATLTVFGLRDDSVRDRRHEMTLRKRGGGWKITKDADTRRCQRGRGSQEFGRNRCT